MKSAIKQIFPGDENYPLLLKEIPQVPPKFHYIGVLPSADSRMLAIVGTRKATEEGRRLARNFGRAAARVGLVVVSGLALGIDAAAHQGALDAGGKTLAVLGNGLPEIYPPSNRKLAEAIIKGGGCVISEYDEGVPPFPSQFLERNRIVSGLSAATVIIEAPMRSGALVTAKNALEQGREVFVVPGAARHPNYAGSHMLIREGARLVSSPDELFEDLSINVKPDMSLADNLIFKTIQTSGELSVDKLVEMTKLEPRLVNETLTLLMFEGLIKERNNKFVIA